MNLDGKLSSHEEIKDEAKIMDSTEGLLKVTVDQVLEKAPSAVEIPPEHTPNGTTSSLNGHMKEGKISNEKPQENGQVEASPDGISTDQSNRSNGEEAIYSLGHAESTTEDASLLKHENEEPKEHYQQDVEGAAAEDKLVHEDTLQTDEPAVDAQQGQNLDPAEVTEDTQQHASTSCIPHDEVVAEAPAGVQISLEPNVDDSDALPDTSDGNTETESAKVYKESCPEDEDIAEHSNENFKLEDQPSKQTGDVDADLVQEEVPKSKNDVPEDMTKTEQADVSTNGVQEELNQESPEDTSDPVCEKTQETSHESSVSASEETTPEHDATTRELALNVQEVQNQGLAEEIADAKEVDAEKTLQQSGVAFEEATREDNVATIEPSSDIQHLNDVESEEIKGHEDAKAGETSNQSNVTTAEDAAQDMEATKDIQPVQGLGGPKSTGTVDMDEASNQPHANVLNNLPGEDGVAACQPQVIELEEDVKDTGVTKTQESHAAASEEIVTEDNSMAVESRNDIQQTLEQGSVEVKDTEDSETPEICHERTISASEAYSIEDDITADGPISDAQEAENVESVEEIKENAADNIVEASNVATVEEADQENNALAIEEPKSTETVEMDEASNQPHADVLNNLAEDGVPACQPQVVELEEEVKDTGVTETQETTQQSHVAASEKLVTDDNSMAAEPRNDDIQQTLEQGSVEAKDTEAPETQEICHERAISASVGDSVEDDVAAEGPTCDAQEVEHVETVEETVNTADNIVEACNVATVEDADQENSVPTSEDVSEQQTRGLEPEEIQNTEPVETEEDFDQRHPALLNDHAPEDIIPSDILKTGSSAEVAETEATKTEALPQESNVSTSEEPASEENITASEITSDAQEVYLEPAEDVEGNKDTGTKDISDQSDESNVASLEEMTTEDNTTILTDASIQQLQEQEPVEFRDTEATEPQGISPSHIVSTSEQSTPEDNVTAEPSPDTQAENLESATVTEETKDVESSDAIVEETPEEHVQQFEAPVYTPPVEEPELEETKNTDNQIDDTVLENPNHEDNPTASESLVMESAEVSSSEATEGQEMPQSEVSQSEDHETEENTTASEPEILEPEPAEGMRDSEATVPRSISHIVSSSEESVPEDVASKEASSDIKEVQTEEPEQIEENNDVEAREISNQSSGTTVGETDQKNLESATVTEETKEVDSTDAIADEETPEEHVQEYEAPVDMTAVEEPELEETKNTEPVEVHDNVMTEDQSAEEVKATEATQIAEIQNESGDLTEDVKSNVALADEATPDGDAKAIEATADITQADEPEPVEVEDNIIASDLPEEEIKDTEAMETEMIPDESTGANISEPTNDLKNNVDLAEEAAPEEHVTESEATGLEEIKNSEPVEVEDNIIASDLPEEEIKDTQAMETEMIPDESTSAHISELTNDVKSNVALAEEEAPEEDVIAAEATIDIPQAQEPELEEIKDTEPVEVEENISATDRSAEEIKATGAINESVDANSSEVTEDVNRNFALEDEAAHEEHVIAAETTVHIPRAQEPELEEIKNTEPVEVKENISASDVPAKEVKETEATETEVISESPDANISESTEDVERNVALTDEAAPEEHVMATEATVDVPRAQEPELEDIKNAEHVEVEESISANVLPAEEVKDTETMETKATTDSTDANIAELTEDVALADEAVPDVHVDITPAQESAVEEINNAEPVEAEDSITVRDTPAEEINDTKAMETEEIPRESTHDSLTATAPLADIQQAPEQEAVEDKKCTDTTENQGEPTPTESIFSTAAELTPTKEETTETESTQDTHVQNATAQETKGSEDIKNQEFSDHSIFSTAEVAAQESPLLGGELASDVQQVLERDSAEETTGIEAVQTDIDQQHGVSNLENPVSENNVPESEAHVANQVQEEKSAEVEDTEARGTEEIPIQVPVTESAAQESSEPGSDPHLLVQSEDSSDQLVKAEETGQSNGASLEEPTAEDNAANETEPLADTKEEHGPESVERNKGIDASEGDEASHPSQDAGLEGLVSERIVATIEPTSDIQQVNDLDEEKEMAATIDDEETSCKKIEVATLEDPPPTYNGTSPKQKDESSDLGEKTAFTTQEGESPTEEDVQISEQSKAGIEYDAVQSGDHTNDQDSEQLVDLQMQVCERSLDVSPIEQPDEDVQKVNLDQQHNEDEAVEKQTEEIQRDEQKHDGSSADLTTETLSEPQSSEIGTTNLHEDTDVFEAEQTETVATEMLMNEQTQHIPQGSIPSIADVKAEKSREIEERSEQENAPNNADTLYIDAEDEKDNIEKPSTDEQDGTIDETINEENPTVVPQSVEPRVHSEEEECINKVNDDMQAIQASEEEIVDKVEKEQEMKNEHTDVHNDEMQTKPVDEEASVLHSNDRTDTKVDDTMSPHAEMVHGRIDAQPEETAEVEANKGFSSISEYVAENSKQNDVEQDLSIHPKVVDENLAAAEQNGAEVETNSNEEMATSYTADTEAAKFDEAIDDKASGAEGALSDENLDAFEDNRRNLEASSVVTASGESMNEDKEHHNLALPAQSAEDGNTTEQAFGSEVTERGLLFPEKPLPTEPEEQEESQTTKQQDEENIHEQETGDMEKEEIEAEQSDLPVSNFLMNLIMGKESTEPEGNSEFEAEKKQEETTKDDSYLITSQQEESLVPISTDLKVENKLIFEQGIHDLEGSEETHDYKLESGEELSRNTRDLEAPVCQNNVQGEISSELVPGGPGMMTEVETRDVKLGEKAANSVCQEHMEARTQIEEGSLKSNLDDSTNPKASQEDVKLGEKAANSVCQEHMEARTQTEEESLKSNLDDSTNPKASQEDTLEEGGTDLRHESLPEDRSSDAVAAQTLLSTEPDMGAEKKLPNDTDDLQSPLSTEREKSTESSIIEAESTIEAELENVEKEEDKHHTTNTREATEGQIEKSHDNSQKGVEAISNEQTDEITEPVMGTEINLVHENDISAGSERQDEKQSYKLSNSELDNSEKALEIQSDGSSLHINQDKQDDFAGEQVVMEENSLLDKPGESILQEGQETEIGQKSPKESDGGDQNCLAIREPVIKEENVNGTVESHAQTVKTKSNEEQETFNSQVQERDLDVVSAKEAPEAKEDFAEMAKPEFGTDEEQSPKKDKSNMAGEKTYDEKTKDEEEAKSFTAEGTTKLEEQGAVQKVSQRDLNVVLPTEAPGSEESFVDVKKPEFSTDEEQSPKKDESNIAEEKSYDEKANGDEDAKNFSDEAPMKIEEREAGQKASPKKHNILSGVGSKVKHQFAKVKKAIIGKPGHTKSELAKS